MTTPPRTPTTQYEPCGKFGCTTPHKPHVAPRCGTCGIPDHYAGDNRHDCGAPDPAPHAPCHEGCDMCAVLDALDAPDPAPLDVERLAQDDNAGGVWVHHTPSKPVRLAGYPALGGSFCRMCGADWPCANVREYATEVQP